MEIWRKGRGIELIAAAAFCLLAAGLWCQPAEAAGESEGAKDADMNVYDIGEITVEAKRPNWEEKLSPGTVTVIRPEEFKGEQKTLPDFLQMGGSWDNLNKAAVWGQDPFEFLIICWRKDV